MNRNMNSTIHNASDFIMQNSEENTHDRKFSTIFNNDSNFIM